MDPKVIVEEIKDIPRCAFQSAQVSSLATVLPYGFKQYVFFLFVVVVLTAQFR